MYLENSFDEQILGEASVTHRNFACRYITPGSFYIGIYVLYHVTWHRIKSITGGDMNRLTRLDKTHDQYFISGMWRDSLQFVKHRK